MRFEVDTVIDGMAAARADVGFSPHTGETLLCFQDGSRRVTIWLTPQEGEQVCKMGLVLSVSALMNLQQAAASPLTAADGRPLVRS